MGKALLTICTVAFTGINVITFTFTKILNLRIRIILSYIKILVKIPEWKQNKK